MKCLSIKQPWAWLIMNGKKTIETRTWKAPDSVVGTVIGIQAALKMETVHYQIQALRFGDMPSSLGLRKGKLLGTALLTRVIEYRSPEEFFNDTDKHLCYKGAFQPVRFGFEFTVIERYKFPKPLKGALGFFEYPTIQGEVE